MDKCLVLTVFLALSLRVATAGRHHNDGHGFHHHLEVNPETLHEPYPHHHKHGPHSHRPHEAKHAHGEDFWGHPESWESHSGSSESDSGSWEYPDFPHHGNHNHPNNWPHHVVDNTNWHDGHHGQLPQYYPGHEPGHQWNHGENNQPGGWHQGGPTWNHERPNLNQGGPSWDQGRPSWNHVGTNLDPVPSPWSQPDRQNQPGRPSINKPGTGWNTARPGGWGQPSSTTTTAPGPTTKAPLAIALCIRSCPVTSEYNPVCGSNNVTYGNPGRLECAKYCGVDVSVQRKQACTAATQNGTQVTNLPPQKPTRFTTIDIDVPTSTQRPTEPNLDTTTKFTISQDILNNIFTTQSTTIEESTGDDNYDIDIRSRNNLLNNQPNLKYSDVPVQNVQSI